MKKITLILSVALVSLLSTQSVHGQIFLDFTTLPQNTPITTQYVSQGLTVATQDANGNFGTAETTGVYPSDWTAPTGISNSTTGEYPTTEFLNLSFALPADVQSFTFNNYGDNGLSYYAAFNSTGTLLGTGNIAADQGETLITVNIPNVSLLKFSNGVTSEDSSWEFAVNSISYTEATAATPEPSTWAMLLGGVGLLAFWQKRTRGALL